MPVLSLVVAMARGGVIGVDQRLPWHLPADLGHFKAITWGKPIVMGRRTFQSIGRVLPGRENVVVSRDPDFAPPGVTVERSVEAALAHCADAAEIMVIGGATLYAACLPRADRLYLTEVHGEFAGDTRFPALAPGAWHETAREDHPADARNPVPYSFVVLERARTRAAPG